MENYTIYRTAESVSPGHPDKLCDQISDAVLDAYLAEDPDSRVAVEVCGGHKQIFITGEVTSHAKNVDIESIAHRIAGDDMKVMLNLVEQSPEIAQGVDTGGAGDQGIMIGYACDETPELLPFEVILSRRLNQYIYAEHPYDGKTQVTIHDGANGETWISSIVASFQNVSQGELKKLVQAFITEHNLSPAPDQSEIELHLNPAGDWHQGGFEADTGLTGRKLIVDNYGPRIPIGGGAFSGKDPSKIDRSAAYMARRIAVDYLHSRNAHEVFVRLAYAIGHAEPLEATVIIDGQTEQISGYDLTPRGIIKYLDLKRPIYEPTARYGHFGEGFDWDK
jgi:S-adenosylmethionine synthetase